MPLKYLTLREEGSRVMDCQFEPLKKGLIKRMVIEESSRKRRRMSHNSELDSSWKNWQKAELRQRQSCEMWG